MALLAASTFLGQPSVARAESVGPPADDSDSALHFGASIGLSLVGYGTGMALFDDRMAAVLSGVSLALSMGASKEALDAAGAGTPEWRDMSWDLAGAVVGVALTVTFDVALR